MQTLNRHVYPYSSASLRAALSCTLNHLKQGLSKQMTHSSPHIFSRYSRKARSQKHYRGQKPTRSHSEIDVKTSG